MNLQRTQVFTGMAAIALLIVVFEVIPMPAKVIEFKWLTAVLAGLLLVMTTAIELTQRKAREEFAASVEVAVGIRRSKWGVLKRIDVMFVVFMAVLPFVLIANYLGISHESVAEQLGISPLLLAIFAIAVTGGSIWGVVRGLGWKVSRPGMEATNQGEGV